jgi:hypothetical protein
MDDERRPLATWVREGLRAGLFLRPRVEGAEPGGGQLVALLVVLCAVDIGLSRFEVPGTATFDVRGWLGPWWGVAAMALMLWLLLPRSGDARRTGGLAAWFALWFMAVLPSSLVAQALAIAEGRGWISAASTETMFWIGWGSYFFLWCWTLAMAARLAWHFGLDRRRLSLLTLGLVAIFGVNAWQFAERPWRGDEARAAEPETPRLVLNQETLEAQQSAWTRSVAAIAPERPGVADVYGLVFAPYAPEDVFLRESTMVAKLLADRFDAAGRVLHLVNHATTAESLPWATPLNLKRAVEALAARMDRENDLLVVYLTSHGASDYRLAASHWPLDIDPVSPGELREALDAAGIRHRVIAVSACFSGGWTGPLGGDHALVMTAADATHTSYGCGKLSELTFFGRAVFDEQLRKTHSFERAFAAAVPVIRQREEEAGKADGFSNPQISVGDKSRPYLAALEQRLDAPKPAGAAKP